ncbi:hypothetical protein ACJBU6_00941 [Exserohilum turcicum]
MPTAIEHLGAKLYLIHTPLMHRPFLTTVPFIAGDFAAWGYRVDQHQSNSPYVAEIRARERQEHMKRRARDVSQRTRLMEMWATEIIERKKSERQARRRSGMPVEAQIRQEPTMQGASGFPHARVKKTGDFVQDFLNGLVECGRLLPASIQRATALTNPRVDGESDVRRKRLSFTFSSATSRICQHVRFLYAIRYVPSAALPEWSRPSVSFVDQVVMEYHCHRAARRDQYSHALDRAIRKDEGRMGRVEHCA